MYFWPIFETAKLAIFRFCQTINLYKMQNSFEQLTEILEQLELTCKNGLSLPDIEKDIVLEKLRMIYTSLKSGIQSLNQPEEHKYGVYQGLDENVDLFFDTEHESYAAEEKKHHTDEQAKIAEANRVEEEQKKLADEQREEMKRITEELRRKEAEEEKRRLAEEQRRKEEEKRRLAEEQRRKEEEQKRLAEEQRRKEEEQKRLAEEQRRKEEEQKRLAEEQRRKEEEQKRLAEEQRRKEEEQKRLAEEQRRKEEEQKRLAEEQRRKEEEQKRLAEEQRRKEEEQKRLAEEQRRKEEEQKRLAEEQRRKEEEQKRLAEEQRRKEEQIHSQPVDEDDLLQFRPKTPTSNKPQQRSLNDLFNPKGDDRSLGAQYQNAKVTDLTKAISINDKFTYIKELFNNKGEEFSAAITQLNQCRNMDEAFSTLEMLKQKHLWESTSNTYLSLCDLLRRKFN